MTHNEVIDLLRDKNTDIMDVDKIYQDNKGSKEIESMVAMNLSMRTSVYDKQLEKSETMTNLLIALSASESMEARWAVAKNPHTPIDVLDILSNDKINLVRALVATNHNTPTKTLDKFFSDEKIVRDGLSGNPNTSEKLLKILADDSDKMVRLRIAENPASTNTILEKLLQDTEQDVVKAAQKRLGV